MSGETDEDARLMLAFQAGDRRAFEALFGRYSARLVNFLARMVPDRARAEELAQDVFVRVYQARDRYQATARFSTYVFGIASNLALNDLDRAYRRRERPIPEEREHDWADSDASVEERIDAQRTHAVLEEALEKLAPRQRAALLLRTDEGLGYEQIAEALGVTVASIKSLLHRARGELLTALDARGVAAEGPTGKSARSEARPSEGGKHEASLAQGPTGKAKR